ncbi:MAG: hypothetical protein IJP38_00910 [Oscillospiraceae bacterium]|nr:hypothetical protein [Oscillospiraceae bacterium]MBQ9984852.1 hypothetical protein [Oscillospiraceae bacterium]
MKRFLSIFLAVTMILAMLPTAFAAVDETTGAVTYEFNAARSDGTTTYLDGKSGTLAEAYMNYPENPADAGEKWAYLGTTIAAAANVKYGFCYVTSTQLWTGNAAIGEWVALKIYVPKTGTYNVSAKGYQRKTYSKSADLYVAYMNDDLKTKLGADASSRTPNTTTYGTASAGERSGASSFEYLGIPETAKVGSVSFYGSSSSGVEKDLITGVEMNLTEGDNVVLFKATALNNDGTAAAGMHPSSMTLTPVSEETTDEPEEVTENISFVATSNVGEGDMMSVEAENFTYDDFTDSIPVGTFVKVTAPEKPGYEFKHWVRGSADNGVYVSDNPAYSFTALTHTFLTAIYENVSNEGDNTATVEFYNGNGQYLDKAVSTVGGTVSVPDKAKAPAMTGFEFANQWRTEDGVFDASAPLAKKLTRAVAQFNTPSTTFTITCGEEEVPLTYGSKHTFTSNNPVYWTRESAVVGYGTSYTHAAWDTTEITTSKTGELAPVVLLDDTKKDGAYMIEYNAAGKEILEVGIVFGGEGVNIGSCSSKATSQHKNQHGQFTAKPYGTESSARGYMIYEDTDGSYKVIYSE